jgi:hypothetical protein
MALEDSVVVDVKYFKFADGLFTESGGLRARVNAMVIFISLIPFIPC